MLTATWRDTAGITWSKYIQAGPPLYQNSVHSPPCAIYVVKILIQILMLLAKWRNSTGITFDFSPNVILNDARLVASR